MPNILVSFNNIGLILEEHFLKKFSLRALKIQVHFYKGKNTFLDKIKNVGVKCEIILEIQVHGIMRILQKLFGSYYLWSACYEPDQVFYKYYWMNEWMNE